MQLVQRRLGHAADAAGGEDAAVPQDGGATRASLAGVDGLDAAARLAHGRDGRGVELPKYLLAGPAVLGHGQVDGVDEHRRRGRARAVGRAAGHDQHAVGRQRVRNSWNHVPLAPHARCPTRRSAWGRPPPPGSTAGTRCGRGCGRRSRTCPLALGQRRPAARHRGGGRGRGAGRARRARRRRRAGRDPLPRTHSACTSVVVEVSRPRSSIEPTARAVNSRRMARPAATWSLLRAVTQAGVDWASAEGGPRRARTNVSPAMMTRARRRHGCERAGSGSVLRLMHVGFPSVVGRPPGRRCARPVGRRRRSCLARGAGRLPRHRGPPKCA